jgi:hypothetical protein
LTQGAILLLPGLPPKKYKNTVTTNPKNVLINKVSAGNGCKINVYQKGVVLFLLDRRAGGDSDNKKI